MARTSDILYRSRLGIPWVMVLLIGTCFAVTAPVLFDPHRHYLTLGIGFCEEDAVVHAWKYIVAKFIHGAGCGFPPTWFHLGVNVAVFAVEGVLVERVLGSGRVALLTFTCLAVQIAIEHALGGPRAHGASAMAWAYVPFAVDALARAWARSRWRMFAELATVALAAVTLFTVLGLAKSWHLWSGLASVPFYLAWRRTFAANLEAIARGAPAERGRRSWNAGGVAAALAIALFSSFFVVSAVSGRITPEKASAALPG